MSLYCRCRGLSRRTTLELAGRAARSAVSCTVHSLIAHAARPALAVGRAYREVRSIIFYLSGFIQRSFRDPSHHVHDQPSPHTRAGTRVQLRDLRRRSFDVPTTVTVLYYTLSTVSITYPYISYHDYQ